LKKPDDSLSDVESFEEITNAEGRYSTGKRMLPFSSLMPESETPIYVNRVHESFDLLMHTHDFIEICMVTEGAGVHYIGKEQMQVARGDMFFIPIGVSHVFRPQSTGKGRPLILYNCTFRIEMLGQLLETIPVEAEIYRQLSDMNAQKRWVYFRDRSEEGQQLFRKLHLEFTSRRPGFTASLYSGTLELLVMVYRAVMPERTEDQATSSMKELADYIQENIGMALQIADMASRLGMSERQFQRNFKKHTGMTFIEYVQNARIDQSCRLLRLTRDKVSLIAAAVGYQDLKYFNALFKKKTGVSPRQYRAAANPEG
jgi:AraC family L-rhamnose operon transcriptional activator RhaR